MHKAIKIAPKYVWYFIVRENKRCTNLWWQSNKSDGLHNKGCYHKGQYNVTFLCIKSLGIQIKSAWQPLLPSVKGISFTFQYLLYARVNSMHSHFNLNYSLVGKQRVVGKDLGTYGQSNIFDHDLLLLTIISMINELGGKTLCSYLSLCSMDSICSKNMLWVLAIIENYTMVEYVELLLKLCWINWIAIAWWLRT